MSRRHTLAFVGGAVLGTIGISMAAGYHLAKNPKGEDKFRDTCHKFKEKYLKCPACEQHQCNV